MKFLADESIDRQIVARLRQQRGFGDVVHNIHKCGLTEPVLSPAFIGIHPSRTSGRTVNYDTVSNGTGYLRAHGALARYTLK